MTIEATEYILIERDIRGYTFRTTKMRDKRSTGAINIMQSTRIRKSFSVTEVVDSNTWCIYLLGISDIESVIKYQGEAKESTIDNKISSTGEVCKVSGITKSHTKKRIKEDNSIFANESIIVLDPMINIS